MNQDIGKKISEGYQFIPNYLEFGQNSPPQTAARPPAAANFVQTPDNYTELYMVIV
jgi:hypothetical protein